MYQGFENVGVYSESSAIADTASAYYLFCPAETKQIREKFSMTYAFDIKHNGCALTKWEAGRAYMTAICRKTVDAGRYTCVDDGGRQVTIVVPATNLGAYWLQDNGFLANADAVDGFKTKSFDLQCKMAKHLIAVGRGVEYESMKVISNIIKERLGDKLHISKWSNIDETPRIGMLMSEDKKDNTINAKVLTAIGSNFIDTELAYYILGVHVGSIFEASSTSSMWRRNMYVDIMPCTLRHNDIGLFGTSGDNAIEGFKLNETRKSVVHDAVLGVDAIYMSKDSKVVAMTECKTDLAADILINEINIKKVEYILDGHYGPKITFRNAIATEIDFFRQTDTYHGGRANCEKSVNDFVHSFYPKAISIRREERRLIQRNISEASQAIDLHQRRLDEAREALIKAEENINNLNVENFRTALKKSMRGLLSSHKRLGISAITKCGGNTFKLFFSRVPIALDVHGVTKYFLGPRFMYEFSSTDRRHGFISANNPLIILDDGSREDCMILNEIIDMSPTDTLKRAITTTNMVGWATFLRSSIIRACEVSCESFCADGATIHTGFEEITAEVYNERIAV